MTALPIDALEGVRVVVVHAYPDGACADGLASLLILRDVFPDAEVRQLAHHTPEYEQLAAEPGMLFCDLSPPEARVQEFVDVGAIVLDHHKGSQHIVQAFGDRGVYACAEREPGVSGALLAHRVWVQRRRALDPHWSEGWDELEEKIYRFASLVGVRDTWRRNSPLWRSACELTATLLFYPTDDWLKLPVIPLAEQFHRMDERVRAVGAELIRKRGADARRLAESADRFTTPEGLRVAVVSSCRVSDAADLLAEVADLVVGFEYSTRPASSLRAGFTAFAAASSSTLHAALPAGVPASSSALRSPALRSPTRERIMRLSFRSRGRVDVSEIARLLGGGGHAGAAGCAVEVYSWSPQPYVEVREIVERWEQVRREVGPP